jgi:Inner membrane component of T3SS, cytoplasmic domain
LLNQDDFLMPYLVLEVTNGQTEHRLRPVLHKRYLIGSGKNCHLQIGEENFPPLHSIILNGPEGAEIELIASSSELIINGEKTESVVLTQDDEVQIGQIKFNVHQQESIGEIMDPSQNISQKHDKNDQEEALTEEAHIVPFPAMDSLEENQTEENQAEINLSELSAEELVDLIQEEEQLIEEYETGIQTGYSALLHEAGITEEQININSTEPETSEDEWNLLRLKLSQIVGHPLSEHDSQEEIQAANENDLEQVVLQLCEFAEELEQRSILISNREKEYSAATEELLSSQKILAEQIDYLLQKADELNSIEQQNSPRRASA